MTFGSWFNKTIKSHFLAFGLGLMPGSLFHLLMIIYVFKPLLGQNNIYNSDIIFLFLTIFGLCMICYGLYERHNLIYYPISNEKHAIFYNH